MEPRSIEVQTRTGGGTQVSDAATTVVLRLLDEHLTVCELIRRTVAEQVRELVARGRLDTEEVRRALDRRYGEASGAARGCETVLAAALRAAARPACDPATEAERAVRAFEAGRFLIIADGRQVASLDDIVSFAPGSRVVFLRLTPLVGG